MPDNGLKAKAQINHFLALQAEISPFTDNKWLRLTQIHQVLAKFNGLTLFLSKRPQISLAVLLYYELHDLLHKGSESQGAIAGLDHDIAYAIKEGLTKYKKYYTFIDNCDVYYTALILDPRVKRDLISSKIEDKEAGNLILKAICDNLYQRYSLPERELQGIGLPQLFIPTSQSSNVESRILQQLQPKALPYYSDIDQYFDNPRVTIVDTTDTNWLCNWWRVHKDELPQMAAAARDFLAIPASEVAVERLFNKGRDLLGIRRHSMKAETTRMLILIDDAYST